MVTDVKCDGDSPQNNFHLFVRFFSSHRPEYEDGWGRYSLLVRDAMYFGKVLSRFIHHVRTTHRFVPSTQLTIRYTPYFGKVFVYRTFPGTNRPWRQTTTSPPCGAKAKNDLNSPLFHFFLWLQSTVHRLNTGNFYSFLVDDTKWKIYRAVCPPPPPDTHTIHCRGIFRSKWYRYQNLSHVWLYWTRRH